MRPIDLMAFKIDDQHKAFIKDFHNEQKNYKIAKQFEAYSWGYNNDFQLGYTQLNNDRRHPKKIQFSNLSGSYDYVSVKDTKISDTFSLTLSEEGKVYSWGLGMNGHLGHGDENSRIIPQEIEFDFKSEEKFLKNLKKKHNSMKDIEELITLHSFVKNASQNRKGLQTS